jgi:hypothetical protein
MDKLNYTIRYTSYDNEDKLYVHDKLPLSFVLTENRTLKNLNILDVQFDIVREDITDEAIAELEEITCEAIENYSIVLEEVVNKFQALELKEEKVISNVTNSEIEFTKDYYSIKVSIEKGYVTLYVYDNLNDDSNKYVLNLWGLKKPNTQEVFNNAVSLLFDFYNFTNTLSINLWYDVNKLFSK